jgi:hypothetical protein
MTTSSRWDRIATGSALQRSESPRGAAPRKDCFEFDAKKMSSRPLAACGGLIIRPERRLAIGAQLAKLHHNERRE